MSKDKRQYIRVSVHAQVQITGVDHSGRQFAGRAGLLDVGGMGCRFLARNAVQPGDIIGIEPLGPSGEKLPEEFPRMFIAVWTRFRDTLVEVGARCLEEHELVDGPFHDKYCSTRACAGQSFNTPDSPPECP